MRTSAAVARGAARLGSAAESRTLLAHVLGVEPGRLALAPDVTDAQLADLDALVARRLAGEPLQHLTGVAHFRTISVEVGPGVFVPRPETEVMTGWALECLRSRRQPPQGVSLVELCAGSGAISRALASELPGPVYYAVELSETAWPYLMRNLEGTGVQAVHADMNEALHDLDGTVDLVIANPPYVPEAARDTLPTDVLRDPADALFSGPDGLDALRVVARVAARLLRPGGWVCSEHDDTHGDAAPALFRAAGFVEVADHADMTGRPRFVTARARASVNGRMGA